MKSIKKIVRLFWSLMLLPLLSIPYSIINSRFIVNWLGCGCPKIDEKGNYIVNYFDANDFTLLFLEIIACLILIISLFNFKLLDKWYLKVLYLLIVLILCYIISSQLYYLMQWN